MPAPPTTAIQKPVSPNAAAVALPEPAGANDADPAWRVSLPPAVAARLRSLLDRQTTGKPLTAAERAEAQGLLDIAEFFVVQRMRLRLAA